jgi:hypothetical protein
MRLRAVPFNDEVTKFIAKYDQVFVVEMNRDGQMHQILLTEYPQFAGKLISVAYQDGLPAAAKWVREGILAKYEVQKADGGKQKKTSVTSSLKGKKTASKAKPASKSKKAAVTSKVAKKPVKKSAVNSKTSAKSKKK